MNPAHGLVHVLVGGAGVFCGVPGGRAPRLYGRSVGGFCLLLAILGVLTPSGFGVIPLGEADIALHLGAGASALWIGTAEADQPLPSVDEGTVTR